MRLVVAALVLICDCSAVLAATAAAVINGYEAVSNNNSIASIATSLGTTVQYHPERPALVEAFQNSNIVYINAHTYSGKDHPNRHGALVSGGRFKESPDTDLILPAEMQGALSTGPKPKLVVLAGCSGAKYGWDNVLGPTVISFTKDIKGVAADIYFKYFFHYWTQNDVTIDQALAHADSQWSKDPDAVKFFNVPFMRSAMRLKGNRNLKYKEASTEELQELWRKAVGLWQRSDGERRIRIYDGGGGELVGTWDAIGDLAGYQVEKGDFVFDKGKPTNPRGNEIKGRYFSYLGDNYSGEKFSHTSCTITVAKSGNQFVLESESRVFDTVGSTASVSTKTNTARSTYNRVGD